MKTTRLSFRDELGLLWRRRGPQLDVWFQRACIAAALIFCAWITIVSLLK